MTMQMDFCEVKHRRKSEEAIKKTLLINFVSEANIQKAIATTLNINFVKNKTKIRSY